MIIIRIHGRNEALASQHPIPNSSLDLGDGTGRPATARQAKAQRGQRVKGESTVIKHLNGILKNELTAVNQYFLHARMLKDWGIKNLADKVYEESIGEMKHADKLVERILFLDSLPNLQDLGKLKIGETVPEMFRSDLALEMANRTDLQPAIEHCESVQDYLSRRVLTLILDDTEEHIGWLETQLGLIDKLGLENYLAEQMR